ncbi:sodium:proton exchanger [Candidatus Parcubacteria bacterium]|nr:MAG: sodium:proton exchanger [Candidatus Parcubacteria bacterium]
MLPPLTLFGELSVLIAAAVTVSFVMRLLKQPLIIGHIATGLLVGPLVLNILQSREIVHLFSEIGIAFLLFIVGINLSPNVIRKYGKIAVVTGVGQVVVTTAAGLVIAIALGFSLVTSLYISVALAFSSTIIILKLITDRGDIETLYAKISIGFLLVQDLIAVLLLFSIPILSLGNESWADAALTLGKGIFFGGALLFASFHFLPKINAFLSRSPEFLFLFSIAWGMVIAALFKKFGFSLESGALLAGVALSTLPSRHEISARLAPLRDFFIVLFFILLGSQMVISDIGRLLTPAIVFSLLVLVGNPIILMAIMGYLGYRKRTSLQTGLTVAQISEFSLILVALGVKLGHVPVEILSLATLVGLVTIFGCTYLILYSNKVYRFLAPHLGIFERRNIIEEELEEKEYPFILFGCNRIGYDFIQTFRRSGKNFLVVDYNPDIVRELSREGINVEYGDAGDLGFLESLNVETAELVVSTLPDVETNLLIATVVRQRNHNAVVFAVAHQVADALKLYTAGVDYVVLPHFLGGQYAASLIEKLGSDKGQFAKLRNDHLAYLNLRSSLGHEYI